MIMDQVVLEDFEMYAAHLDALNANKVAVDCGGRGVDYASRTIAAATVLGKRHLYGGIAAALASPLQLRATK